MRKRAGIGALAAIGFLLAACGSGGDSELDKALDELVTGDLATLILPLDELGSVGRDMVIDPESGPRDNAATAESSIDPEDTATDQERAGRLGGFAVDYVNDGAEVAGDLFMISPSVHLYEDADAASAALKKAIEDFEAAEGEDRDGLVVEDVELFDVNVGDEAQGVTFTTEVADFATLRGTAAYGRIGRLGFTVGIIAVGDDSWEEDVQELAQEQADWITGVLKGEIEAEPIEIPSPSSSPVTGGDAPPLDVLALQLDDLPPGFQETDAGFEENDPAGEFDYTRSFEAIGDFVEVNGGTRVISIDNNIIVFGDAVEARAFIAAVAALLEGDDGAEFLSSLLVDEGLEVESLEIEQRDVELGEQTKVVEARAVTDLGDVVLSFIMSRQGRVVSVFIVTGEAEAWDLRDIGPLAELVFARLADAGVE